jgi:NADH-quinone oxidoreductase subunit J
VYLFQAAGMILFVAMIGAIVLTLRQREGVKKQRIAQQLKRTRAESVELVKVKPGEGI